MSHAIHQSAVIRKVPCNLLLENCHPFQKCEVCFIRNNGALARHNHPMNNYFIRPFENGRNYFNMLWDINLKLGIYIHWLARHVELSCITIGSPWPSLQPKVGQTHFAIMASEITINSSDLVHRWPAVYFSTAVPFFYKILFLEFCRLILRTLKFLKFSGFFF